MALFPTKDTTYNNQKIGMYAGADFMFFDTAVMSADAMDNFLRSMMTVTDQAISGSVLANSRFTPVYGAHHFSAPTGQSLCSFYLPVPSEGMLLTLNGANLVGHANIFVSTVTGAAVQRPSGSAISSFNLSAAALLKLLCTTDGTWSIIENNASVTVRVAS